MNDEAAHVEVSGEERQSARKSWKPRLAALVISLSVGGFFAEIVARMRYGTPIPERLPIGRVQANPHRGWQMVPGEDHYTYEHLVEINALGLRGPEVPEELAENEVRILTLGDSMLYGQGVATSSTIPEQLERLLQEEDADGRLWRVINGGHRAYATNQELGLLRELGPRLRPKLVVLFWYDNDFEEFDLPATHADLEASGPRAFDVGAALEGSVLWKWKLKQIVRRSALAMIVHDRLRDGTKERKDAQFYADGFATLEQRLDEFSSLCAELGALPVLSVIPVASTLEVDGPAKTRAERVEQLARDRSIRVVELLPRLRDLRRELDSLPILPYDGHYLGVANRRMAEVLAPVLGEMIRF